MTEKKWLRVGRLNPCCKCGRDNWCGVSYDGKLICCMRVQSERPSKNGGWLHAPDSAQTLVIYQRKADPVVELNVEQTLKEWKRTACGNRSIDDLAKELGVSADSLRMLGCVYSDQIHVSGWPMRDGNNNYTGIRLRHKNGRKWSVKGSHPGLFLPQCEAQPEALVVEGGTDVAAGLTMGIFTIGRPSCNGGVNDLITAIKRLKIRRVSIVADCDNDKVDEKTGRVWNPGIEGARGLADLLPIPSRIVTLPVKDLRLFVNQGGTLALFSSIARQLVWNNPK